MSESNTKSEHPNNDQTHTPKKGTAPLGVCQVQWNQRGLSSEHRGEVEYDHGSGKYLCEDCRKD